MSGKALFLCPENAIEDPACGRAERPHKRLAEGFRVSLAAAALFAALLARRRGRRKLARARLFGDTEFAGPLFVACRAAPAAFAPKVFVGPGVIVFVVVFSGERACRDDRLALRLVQGAEPRGRGADEGALNDRRLAFPFEEGNEGLARSKLKDRLLGVERGIGPEGLGRGLDRALLAGRERAKGVLDAIAELADTRSGTSSGFCVM